MKYWVVGFQYMKYSVSGFQNRKYSVPRVPIYEIDDFKS